MRWCMRCGTTFPPHIAVCPNDGFETLALVPQQPGMGAPWPQQPMPMHGVPQPMPMHGVPMPVPMQPMPGMQPMGMPMPMPHGMPMPAPGWPPQTPYPPGPQTPAPPGHATPQPPGGDRFIGKMVGNFELVRRIGAGGMGAVYEGRHPVVGNRVAVKVMTAGVERDAVERFFTEARTLNQVSHANIVKLLDLGQHPEGFHYCVMELLEGPTLAEAIKAGRIRLPRALKILAQIADALAAAHAKGIVHRDLKPGNVILLKGQGEDDIVKLLDFGIAKLASGHGGAGATITGTVIGTPAYMSPEQAAGRISEIDARSDIYALGIVAYELCTGVHPYVGRPIGELIAAQISEPPKPPGKVHRIPDELDLTILRLLEKKRDARPADARVVAARLRDIHGRVTTGTSAPPAPAPPPAIASRPPATPPPATPAPVTPAPRPPSTNTGEFRRAQAATSAASPTTGERKPAPRTATRTAPRSKVLPILAGLFVLLVLAGAAVVFGMLDGEKVVATSATTLGLAPEASKAGAIVPAELDGTKGAFSAAKELDACKAPLKDFRAIAAPRTPEEVVAKLGARLAAMETLKTCLTKTAEHIPVGARWAAVYVEGVAAFEFAKLLDDLSFEMKDVARAHKDAEGAAPFFVEQYTGIARDRLQRARPDAPATQQVFVDAFLQKLGAP